MIVTADPLGDFNATSQILRYSALAREITVPRIPSVTSTILNGAVHQSGPKIETDSGRGSPSAMLGGLGRSSQEIARLTEELDILSLRLTEESTRRHATEACWQATELRMQTLEQDVREECHEEMETRIEVERRRWRAAWDEELDRNDEHLDRKIEILAGGIEIHADPDPTEDERVCELEDENASLRRRVEELEREIVGRSPTKKQRVLKSRKWEVDVGLESP